MRERGATNLIRLENDTPAPKFVLRVTATVRQAGTPVKLLPAGRDPETFPVQRPFSGERRSGAT